MDDEKLILRLQNGDETAFNELYKKYHMRLYHLALRMSNSEADASDALQDTFLEVHRSIHKLREPKYFSLWVRKILLSKIKRIFAKNKVTFLPDHDYRMMNEEEAYQDYLPEVNMHFHSDQITMQDFVNRLPYHYREVLLLTYYEGWKNQDIAKILDIPIGTVKSRLNMARKMLKQDIESYERANHVKLDFHADVLAGALLTTSTYYVDKIKERMHELLQFGTGVYGKMALGLLLMGLGMYGTLSFLEQMPKENAQPSSETSHTNDTKIETMKFKPVILDGVQYLTPYQAYLGLKEYMHCGYEMKQATQSELEHIKPLYIALKDEDGVYYELLEKQGWVKEFEKFSNH